MNDTRPYGCRDRAPLRDTVQVQDGWVEVALTDKIASRMPRMVTVPNPMSKHCQYSMDTVDPRCHGCMWENSVPNHENDSQQ